MPALRFSPGSLPDVALLFILLLIISVLTQAWYNINESEYLSFSKDREQRGHGQHVVTHHPGACHQVLKLIFITMDKY